MNTKKSRILLISLLLLSVIIAACGSGNSGFPTGKFIKAGTTEYGLAFNKDGTFSVFDGNTTFVTGTYKVEGNVFTETSNDGGCDTNVSFNYTFDGKNLTFKYVGDPADDADCTGRNADFNNVTYTLTK
jgi:predicted small secreted protein